MAFAFVDERIAVPDYCVGIRSRSHINSVIAVVIPKPERTTGSSITFPDPVPVTISQSYVDFGGRLPAVQIISVDFDLTRASPSVQVYSDIIAVVGAVAEIYGF